jgi:hypothetical protein
MPKRSQQGSKRKSNSASLSGKGVNNLSGRKRRVGLLQRVTSAVLLFFRSLRRPAGKRHASSLQKLLPEAPQKRSLAQWKELRRRTTAEVKAHLAEQQPVPAIKKLTRALLEDPQHPAYHELLKKAVEQKRQRRIKAGRKDPWAELPKDLKQEALQLEAFSAYVDELEQLFDKAGIPPLSAPPPPDQRQAGKGGKGKGAKAKAKAQS